MLLITHLFDKIGEYIRLVDCYLSRCPYTIVGTGGSLCPCYLWGRLGFDVGRETPGACRGTDHLVNPAVTLIVANDDNYALAA